MYIPVRVIDFTFVTNLGKVTKVKSITLTGIYISSLSWIYYTTSIKKKGA
jgi:hypothetical protein